MTLLELKEIKVNCPYCGEEFFSAIDTSIEQQDYIEDCQICCSPILFEVSTNDDEAQVSVRRENE